MKISINSWYGEPNVKFNISYKVNGFIRTKINEELIEKKKLPNDDSIVVTVTTKKDIKEAKLSERSYDKKNKIINYSFWLPYDKIIDSKNQLQPYLDYFFILLEELFMIYNVPKAEIQNVKKKVEEEVIKNEEYNFIEHKDKIDVNKVLKNLGIK